MKAKYYIALAGLISLLASSCGGGHDESHHDGSDTASVVKKDTTKVTVSDTTKFKFDYMIANIPSPANIIQEISSYGTVYDKTLLEDPQKAMGLPSERQKAYHLGVYNIDMAYSITKNVGVDVVEYARASMILSEQLGLSSAVNNMVGKRAENNMSNKDSIFKIIDEILIKSDDYLRTNKRVHTAAYIFTGSWLEAMYLNTRMYDLIPTQSGKEKARRIVWEQQTHLGNLINLFSDFKVDAEEADLIKQLKELREKIMKIKKPGDMTDDEFRSISEMISRTRQLVVV